MKTVLLLSTLLALTMADFKVTFPIEVPVSTIKVVNDLVKWMIQSTMFEDAWVLQLSLDKRCHNCTLLPNHKLLRWPSNCDSCVDSFWSMMEKIEGCPNCRCQNKDCGICQATLCELYETELAVLNHLAVPYFEFMKYVWELYFCFVFWIQTVRFVMVSVFFTPLFGRFFRVANARILLRIKMPSDGSVVAYFPMSICLFASLNSAVFVVLVT